MACILLHSLQTPIAMLQVKKTGIVFYILHVFQYTNESFRLLGNSQMQFVVQCVNGTVSVEPMVQYFWSNVLRQLWPCWSPLAPVILALWSSMVLWGPLWPCCSCWSGRGHPGRFCSADSLLKQLSPTLHTANKPFPLIYTYTATFCDRLQYVSSEMLLSPWAQ